MKHQKIYTSIDNYTLLHDSKPKQIGFTKDGQHYVSGGCIIPFVVVLHFGTKYNDRFYWENGNLVYNTVYPGRDWDILELYAELAKKKEISPEEFIKEVVEKYTLKEMGFEGE